MGEGSGAGEDPGLVRATALQLLCKLGWNFLPAQVCAALRGGLQGVLLAPRLAEVLQSRRFDYKGRRHALSPAGIGQVVQQLSAPGLAEGLLPANEQLYNQLAFGITVTEPMPDGKRHQPTMALIDWHDPAANRWDVAELPPLLSASGTHVRAPGLVCFVNGIPLVVIEAAASVDEGIGRHLLHQRPNEIPLLFAHAQLLLALGPGQGRYGTTGTPAEGWASWHEEEPIDALSPGMPAALREVPPQAGEPDSLLAALLLPARLLEFLRVFVLFDRKAGKVVARPPQFFATRALVTRLSRCPPGARREGGIVWHAAGAGGGFTMAFLAKALVLHPGLAACRVVVVADRPGLEDRLARNCPGSGTFGPVTALQGGDGKARAGTGRELARRIGQGTERLLFMRSRKFGPALRLAECHNPSPELVVLVDEGGWRPDGHAHERLRRALPQAACLAFTATPLPWQEMAASPFGPLVHAYSTVRAVDDGVVLPLLHEARVLPGSAAGRMEAIARDVAAHFSRHVRPLGLKGVVAAAGRLDAIHYQRLLDGTGLVRSAVLIAAPGRREGGVKETEDTLPELRAWWDANVGRRQVAHEARVLQGFGGDGGPDLLIVVDRLPDAMSEPRAAVLYLDRPLHDHALVRAVAGLNRRHGGKRHGVLLDYRGASLQQAGLDGLFQLFSSECRHLPGLHAALWALLAGARNRRDLQACSQALVSCGARQEFSAALARFSQCLHTALSSCSFLADPMFPLDQVAGYQEDLAFFSRLCELLQIQDAPEGVAYGPHEAQGPLQAQEPAGAYQARAQGRAQAYIGILRRAAGEPGFAATQAEQWAEEAAEADRVVQDAVQEHSLNPHDIEAAIRKALLPRLFGLMGLERAKVAVDQVIQLMRLGLARSRGDAVTARR